MGEREGEGASVGGEECNQTLVPLCMNHYRPLFEEITSVAKCPFSFSPIDQRNGGKLAGKAGSFLD